MQKWDWKLSYKGIFLTAWFVLLVSRILVLTENYSWPVGPVLLEIVYLVLTISLTIFAKKGVFFFRRGSHWYVLGALLLHTLLWGLAFVDQRFLNLIQSHFKSQIMFAVILTVTVWAVQCFDAEQSFVKCCSWALSCTLIFQLITLFSEVDLSNLVNIMSATERTRANFGFGHYNTLGAACACNILLLDEMRRNRIPQLPSILETVCLVASVVMLLCSASRSALTSLILYAVVYAILDMDRWGISKRLIFAMRMLISLATIALAVYLMFEIDIAEFLILAQRSHLFNHTLPMFMESGNTWLGLGYASNVAYATQQTPYTTYWMDNGYIYLLVTTGVAGFGLLASSLACTAGSLIKKIKTTRGKQMLAVLCVYLYISLFEAVLFSSGSIVNYIYLPWLCFVMAERDRDS